MIFRLVALIARRAASLLTLSFLSLCIGGFLFGAVLTFTTSINTYLVGEAKTLIGGDVVLSSPYPISDNLPIITTLKEEGHTIAEARSFQGVFTTEENSAPASIRAVGETFPLYGKVELADKKEFKYEEGGLYAEESFLSRLSLRVGDAVEFAGKTFTVRGVLLKEPDTISVGVSFAPKVIVFLKDIETITVPLSESRTRYRIYLKENSIRPLTSEKREELKTFARDNRLRFDDASDGPNNLLEGFSSVDDFVGVVLAVALFLVVINIGANLVYLLSRFRKTIALLKIYGATSKTIQKVFLSIFGVMGVLAGTLGASVGVYVAGSALALINKMYLVTLVSRDEFIVVLSGGVFGGLFIMLAALPFLNLVKKVEPKELLLNQVKERKSLSLKQLVLYVPVPIFMGLVLFFVSKNIYVSIGGVVLCAVVFVIFMVIIYLLLKSAYSVREKFSFLGRSIISFLYLRKLETLVSAAAIMTAFSLVFLVTSVRHNLELNLRTNISVTAPSMYLVDITKSQLEEIKLIAGESFKQYPVVRGRLLYVNDRNLLEEDNRELRREFNLTYRDTLIDGETLISGEFGGTQNGTIKTPVSVEKNFADELGGVSIGDTIEIFIQGVEIKAVVTSIREVDQTSGIPFFYLVFPTKVLESFPASFFGTVQVDEERRRAIESEVARKFPNIIPIVTTSVVEAITELVENVVTVVALVSIPSIILGLLLIVVMLSQNMYERSADVLVLRAFGLTKRRVILLFLLEGGTLVALSGILSYFVAHGITFFLNVTLFSFSSFGFVLSPLYMICGNIALVICISYLLSTRITKRSLKELLAEK